MTCYRIATAGLGRLFIVGASTAFAHLTYPVARDFGSFSLDPRISPINGQTTKAFGWADGTDADFGHQDDQRYFKFTLETATFITISITSQDPANFLPAFSIFSGVGHGVADTSNPDYDGAQITRDYLESLRLADGITREGAFDALHTWKIANDPATSFADLATLVYVGHMADGTSDNFGLASGIIGDGVADGFVTATFELPAGVYTLVVGGANYYTADATSRAFNAIVTNIPEPSCAILLAAGLLPIGLLRRRSSTSASA